MEEIEDLILSDVVEERKEVPIEEKKKEPRTHKSAFLAEDDGKD